MIRLIALLVVLAGPAFAVQPGEMLDDPALEARARDISQGLRCPVCRNENIDESNSDVSGDLRRLVRDRLVAGDSNDDVVAYVVARYGEYVLLEPTRGGANTLLWWAGPFMLAGGLGLAALYLRRRGKGEAPDPLNSEEEARLREILDQ